MIEAEIIKDYLKETRSFSPGQKIFQEAGEFGEVFVILEGEIRIKKATSKGAVAAARLRKGDILGEAKLFDPASDRRSVTAVAEDDVLVGVLDSYRISTELNTLSPRLKWMLRALARRLRWTTNQAASLARAVETK